MKISSFLKRSIFKLKNKSIFKRMRRETADFLLFMDDVKNDQNVFGLAIA